MRWDTEDILVRGMNLFLSIAIFSLGFRIIFQLFGANPTAPFVDWVYTISSAILVPFNGIFPSTEITGNSVLDIPAFVALFMYTLLINVSVSLIQGFYHLQRNQETLQHKKAIS